MVAGRGDVAFTPSRACHRRTGRADPHTTENPPVEEAGKGGAMATSDAFCSAAVMEKGQAPNPS